MTEILKILSPVAVLAIIWSIIQFIVKRKYEKNDKKKDFQIKILTDFLTEINDIRVLSTEIFNQFNKRTKKIRGTLSDYENDKLVHQIADKNVHSENFINEVKPILENLTLEEQKEYLEKSVNLFKTERQSDADLLQYLKEKNKKLEEKALSLNKIPLLNLFASGELMEKREKLIKVIDDAVIFDITENSTDISLYFNYGMEILKLSFEIEYLVLFEIKKL